GCKKPKPWRLGVDFISARIYCIVQTFGHLIRAIGSTKSGDSPVSTAGDGIRNAVQGATKPKTVSVSCALDRAGSGETAIDARNQQRETAREQGEFDEVGRSALGKTRPADYGIAAAR